MADSDSEISDKLLDIIARAGKVEKSRLVPDATLESLGIASIDVVEALMMIEEEIGVYLSLDETLSKASNLQELVSALVDQIKKKKS